MTNILAIGAHPDDIELGCGGTLVKAIRAGHAVSMLVVTKGEVGPGRTSQRIAEQEAAVEVLGVKPSNLFWGDIPDCAVSLHELQLVHLIERVIEQTQASVIFTHNIEDSHQDHRSVALTTLGAARKVPSILTYDAPSSITFNPLINIDITATLQVKVDALLCHASQVAASEMVDPDNIYNGAGFRGRASRGALKAESFQPIRYMVQEF